jgi:hypothetical protein
MQVLQNLSTWDAAGIQIQISSSRDTASMEKPFPRPLYCHLEEERPAMFTRGAIVLHVNAHSPIAHTVQDKECPINWGGGGGGGVYIAGFWNQK